MVWNSLILQRGPNAAQQALSGLQLGQALPGPQPLNRVPSCPSDDMLTSFARLCFVLLLHLSCLLVFCVYLTLLSFPGCDP